MREYSYAQQVVNNLPYVVMTVAGAAILVVGLEDFVWRWIGGVGYFVYGAAGAMWIIAFLCPHCAYWDTKSCPCGYGHISARFRSKKDSDDFKKNFKKHIGVIVPLWFIPVLAGAAFMVSSFSWLMLVLLVVFAVDAFAILPLLSKKHGCVDCPQKELCPWMSSEERLGGVTVEERRAGD